jgi:hypothetical protein
MRKISHIVNACVADKTSDLVVAQPVTFETMRIAKEFASDTVNVDLCAIKSRNEDLCIPIEFRILPDLQRSILDIKNFTMQKKLPLIRDILDTLHENSNADYFIYTNVDIALQPGFYIYVNKLIDDGYDAFVINRRTITKEFSEISDIPLMCAEVGDIHPGYDCFVFRRDVYPDYRLGNACIGIGHIGQMLIANLICNAKRFKLIKHAHVTFHIGDDRAGKIPEFQDMRDHNWSEVKNTLGYFKPGCDENTLQILDDAIHFR